MSFMAWFFILAIIFFGVLFIMNSKKNSRIDAINPQEKIKIGKYLYGFPNYHSSEFSICAVKDNKFHFFENTLGTEMGIIPTSDIIGIEIVDKSTIVNNKWFIEDKKTKKINSFNILIRWKQNGSIIETYFESGIESMGEFHSGDSGIANVTLQKLLKYVPTKTTNENLKQEKPSIADEIKKLAELKDSGVLTEEEFEKQKGKLLDSN